VKSASAGSKRKIENTHFYSLL